MRSASGSFLNASSACRAFVSWRWPSDVPLAVAKLQVLLPIAAFRYHSASSGQWWPFFPYPSAM